MNPVSQGIYIVFNKILSIYFIKTSAEIDYLSTTITEKEVPRFC